MLARSSTTTDLTHKSLRISTHHPKEYKVSSKRLTINMIRDHQSSMANFSSFDHHDHQDHYHGDSSVSIPFMWESQPGTPKVIRFRETSLPPLTPPPSYCYSPVTKRPSQSNYNATSTSTKAKTNNLVKAIFPKKKRNPSAGSNSSSSLSPSSSSSASSTPRSSASYYSPVSSSSPLTPSKLCGPRRRIVSSPRMSVDSRVDDRDEDEEGRGSPVSALCFGRRSVIPRSRLGCCSSLIKVLLS